MKNEIYTIIIQSGFDEKTPLKIVTSVYLSDVDHA